MPKGKAVKAAPAYYIDRLEAKADSAQTLHYTQHSSVRGKRVAPPFVWGGSGEVSAATMSKSLGPIFGRGK